MKIRKPKAHLLKIQLGIGIPMAPQYSITAIGTMMVQTSLNLLGSGLVAAFTAASKIEQVVTQAYVALGTTMATYCAQNIGAGKVQRIRSGFRSATIMSFVYAVISGILIMTVGKYMTYLFVSGDVAEIMASVDIYLKCVGIFFIPLAVVNLYRNGIQGMGYGILPIDGRCGGTCRKRNCRGDRGGKEKLCRRMSGKSDRLDFCGGASDRDVLLYYEA